MRSNVSSKVFTMNQNTPPTSRRKLRASWPIPWATRRGGLAFAMADKSRLTCATAKGKVRRAEAIRGRIAHQSTLCEISGKDDTVFSVALGVRARAGAALIY